MKELKEKLKALNKYRDDMPYGALCSIMLYYDDTAVGTNKECVVKVTHTDDAKSESSKYFRSSDFGVSLSMCEDWLRRYIKDKNS